MLSYKRALPTDAPTLSAIGSATFLETYIELIPVADLLAHCRSQHSEAAYRTFLSAPDPRSACWIAAYATTGSPIGYALTCPPDLPVETDERDIELKRIYVFSRFHSTGAGKALHDLTESHARQIGARRLLLGTYQGNHRAIGFYRKAGYEQVGTRRFQVGDQVFDDLVMAKTL